MDNLNFIATPKSKAVFRWTSWKPMPMLPARSRERLGTIRIARLSLMDFAATPASRGADRVSSSLPRLMMRPRPRAEQAWLSDTAPCRDAGAG